MGIGTETDPTAPRGLTHHWRLSTVPTRTPDEHAVLLTQLLDLEGLDIATSVTGIAVSSSVPHVTGELRQMASRWFSTGALRGARPRHQERHAHPLRQSQGGRRRPGGQRRRGLRPLRRALRGHRHGDGDHGRGHQRGRGVPGRGDHPGRGDQPRGALPARRRAAPGGDGRAPPRHRALDRRVDRIGHPLRLRGPGRRTGPPLHGGARTVHRGGHRRAQFAHRARIRTPSSTWSPG